MLSPLSGLHAAIKRRNSKVRRDSFSMSPSTLPVPSEGSGIRRFSSSETLNGSYLQSLAPSVATVTRRSSLSRRIRKVSSGSNHHQVDYPDPCSQLDMHIAQIKRKLADFREEDVEISERVEELTNCLSDLCHDYHVPPTPVEPCPHSDPVERRHLDPMERRHLDPVEKSSGEESDEQEFAEFWQNHPPVHQGTHTLPHFRKHSPPSHNRTPPTHTAACRSQSHEGLRHSNYSNTLTPPSIFTSPLHPHNQDTRNHYFRTPTYQDNAHDQDTRNYYFRTPTYQDNHYSSRPLSYHDSGHSPRRLSYHESGYTPRPLSYQEISYDENDFEESNILGLEDNGWAELSCP